MKVRNVKNPCEECAKADVCRHKEVMKVYTDSIEKLETPDFTDIGGLIVVNCKFKKDNLSPVYIGNTHLCGCQ